MNKTDSAVRITHLPTGLTAQSQASRSQISNRETALNILKSRLLQQLEKEEKDHLDELRQDAKEIGWGNQIRSYVFHPYKLVKDLRTQHERTDLNKVLDGHIDDPKVQKSLKELDLHCEDFHVLGVFPADKFRDN